MSGSRSLGLLPVVAIGVGGMVGGGIFAVLGLAVQMTHGGAPLAFLLASLVALITAINATLYGAARVSYVIAQDGELPEVLEHKVWRRPVEGLLITAGITLLVANLFDLSGIATMGSAGFLVIFAAVNGANLMLARDTGGRRWLAVLGLVVCLVALAVLMVQGAKQDPKTLLFLPAMLLMATGVEALYRRIGGRRAPAGG